MDQMTTLPLAGRKTDVLALAERARGWAERIPDGLIALCARLGLAVLFWQSGQTKVVSGTAFSLFGRDIGFPKSLPPDLQGLTVTLFAEEYRVPLLPPEVAAWLATTAEHVFPILLLVGLATRLSALGLLGMTAVIQLFVYPNSWNEHLLWAAALLFLIARGGGWLSLDHLIRHRLGEGRG